MDLTPSSSQSQSQSTPDADSRFRRRNRLSRRMTQDLRDADETETEVEAGSSATKTPAAPLARSLGENNAPLDKAGLKAIYSNCLDLFEAKKITVQNAFNLKLIECLREVIASPEFDISNMQVVGRTLEIGTRIYVCRVEYTYNIVMQLVAEVGAKGKNLERLRRELEIANAERENQELIENGELPEPGDDGGDHEADEYEKAAKRTRKKKKFYHVTPNEKITMVFSENSEAFVYRQELVKERFTKFVETRQYFDYSRILEYVDVIKKERSERPPPNEKEAGLTKVMFPRLQTNQTMATSLKFMPYIQFEDERLYDKTIYDPWGRPKKGPGSVEEERRQLIEARKAKLAEMTAKRLEDEEKAREEYAFDPTANHDYSNHDDLEDNGFQNEMEAEGNPKELSFNRNLNDFNDLDDLQNYYKALKEMRVNRKVLHGWVGPTFLRLQRTLAGITRAPGEKRKRKEPQRIALTELNWKDSSNRYMPAPPEKIEIDDRTMERWMWAPPIQPYMAQMDNGDEDEQDEELSEAFENPGQEKGDYVDRILRYFINPNRNILQLFENPTANEKSIHMSQETDWGGDEFGPSNDNEDVREFNDYVSQNPEALLGGGLEAGSQALNSFLNMFPFSMPGEEYDVDVDELDELLGQTGESCGVKYARQPKPINMRVLKAAIVSILCDKLSLDAQKREPMLAEETRTDVLTLVREVFQRVDERTQKYLTLSLLFVALLHVVVELKLFMEPNTALPNVENASIICRGSAWDHKAHIPLPVGMSLDEMVAQAGTSGLVEVLRDRTNTERVPVRITIQDSDSESDMEVDEDEGK